MLGISYSKPDITEPTAVQRKALDVLLADFHSFPWITYRSGFEPIQSMTTKPLRSDSGWGCAIRTAQMITAHSLMYFAYGRESRRLEDLHQDPMYVQTMSLFMDTPRAPLSIHQIIAHAETHANYVSGTFMGHSVATASVARLYAENGLEGGFGVGISSFAGTMCLSVIREKLESNPAGVLVYVNAHLPTGEESLITDIMALFQMPAFRGFVGGDGLWFATYFVGAAAEGLYYLDPHVTQSAFVDPANLAGQLSPQPVPLKMMWARLSTSSALAFAVRSVEELDELVGQLGILTNNFIQVVEEVPTEVADGVTDYPDDDDEGFLGGGGVNEPSDDMGDSFLEASSLVDDAEEHNLSDSSMGGSFVYLNADADRVDEYNI